MDKKEISKFQIDHSKIWADGKKYFSLFEKHLPKIEARKKYLIYDISNLEVIAKMMSLGNRAEFWVFGNKEVNEALRAFGYAFQEVDRNENIERYNIPNMKFDCIIMNPPYERDLHLRILKIAQDSCNFENGGKVVCLHPSKWIRRFDFWKNKFNTFKVESADFIDDTISRRIFESASIGSQLSITVLSKNGKTDYKEWSRYLHWVKEKIIDKAPYILASPTAKFRTTKCDNEFQLNLPIIHGNTGAFDMTEITSKNYERALKVAFGKRPQDINSLAFETEDERRNFYNSTFTNFYKFLIFTCRDGQTATSSYYALPVMDDYTQPWTDERFYKFFNLTENEIKYIETRISKIKEIMK